MALDMPSRVERSKAAILDATLALLAEEGVGGLTVDAVAARAGVGKATVYRHWASRAELIVDAVSSLVTDDEAVDRGSLRADLEAAYERIGQVCSVGILSQVMPTLAEASTRDPELAAVHKEFVTRRRRHLMGAMERAAERGELRPGIDPSVVADLVAGPMFYKKLVHHERPDPAYAKALLDMVLAAIT
ncbi:MAG: TetR/AcrR family transcriptional regulator [Acidimicrobiales bacterium]